RRAPCRHRGLHPAAALGHHRLRLRAALSAGHARLQRRAAARASPRRPSLAVPPAGGRDMTPAPMLDVDTLVIRYRAGLFAARPKPAVNGASFRLERGETLGIVGESGSGKTSLLRAILRLLPVESG